MDNLSNSSCLKVCGALCSVIGMIVMILGVAALLVGNGGQYFIILLASGFGAFSSGAVMGTLSEISANIHFIASRADKIDA